MNDRVSILGPVGNSFSIPRPGQKAFLVAGGVGLPPIRWLGEILRKNSISCELCVGAQSRDLLPVTLLAEPSNRAEPVACLEEFAQNQIPSLVTTDDGSCGMRGRATDALEIRLNAIGESTDARVYACGPEPMLRAVARICAARKVACEVAMERVMGCGMATCQSCVVPINTSSPDRRYALCCRDGPVFDATSVVW